MYFTLIAALCFLQTCALHAAEPQSSQPLRIYAEAVDWDKNFGAYVKNDTGYKHFASLLNRSDAIGAFNHFEEGKICSLFSCLRCATCFAMVFNKNVPEDVFAAALKACHATELYQIFVAADSYYKGRGNSRKFQALKSQAPQLQDSSEEQVHQGAQLSQGASIPTHPSGIFENELSWIVTWEDSHRYLERFLADKLSLPSAEILPRLMELCNDHPYVLLHIQQSHFKTHAPILIPALLQGDNLLNFTHMVHTALPDGPQKEEVCSILAFISMRPSTSYSEALDAYLASLPSSTKPFDYCMQHHAPYLFEKHEHVVTHLYTLLEKYFQTTNQKLVCGAHKLNALGFNDSGRYSLHERAGALSHFHGIRCRTLWQLAEKQELYTEFLHLYSTCSFAEKKALSLNAQQTKRAETPGMQTLKNVTLPAPTEDLSRIVIAADLQLLTFGDFLAAHR